MSNSPAPVTLGCPSCKLDLWTLSGEPVENAPGHFANVLTQIGEHDSDHLTHADCGTALQRKPAHGWA